MILFWFQVNVKHNVNSKIKTVSKLAVSRTSYSHTDITAIFEMILSE